MALEEIKAYEVAVEVLAKNRVNQIILNSGNDHALIVTKNIFNNSRETVRIFAGNLNNDVTKDITYINSIYNFILVNDGKVKIILDRYFEYDSDQKLNGLFSTPLFEKLKTVKKNVTVKGTNRNININDLIQDESSNIERVHFCVGDKSMYRLEYDVEKRKAVCNFNDATTASKCIKKFDEVFDKLDAVVF